MKIEKLQIPDSFEEVSMIAKAKNGDLVCLCDSMNSTKILMYNKSFLLKDSFVLTLDTDSVESLFINDNGNIIVVGTAIIKGNDDPEFDTFIMKFDDFYSLQYYKRIKSEIGSIDILDAIQGKNNETIIFGSIKCCDKYELGYIAIVDENGNIIRERILHDFEYIHEAKYHQETATIIVVGMPLIDKYNDISVFVIKLNYFDLQTIALGNYKHKLECNLPKIEYLDISISCLKNDKFYIGGTLKSNKIKGSGSAFGFAIISIDILKMEIEYTKEFIYRDVELISMHINDHDNMIFIVNSYFYKGPIEYTFPKIKNNDESLFLIGSNCGQVNDIIDVDDGIICLIERTTPEVLEENISSDCIKKQFENDLLYIHTKED